MADAAHDNLVDALVYNIVALGSIIGPGASEYDQTIHTKLNEHKYPSGSKIIYAFIRDDFQLFDESGKQIYAIDKSILGNVYSYSMEVFWCVKRK